MPILKAAMVALVIAAVAAQPQERVSFATQDGGIVYADVYGTGDHGVVLAHGGRFNKESWAVQAQALAKAGFRAVAIDFRGRGQSRGGPQSTSRDDGVHFDVLAAVRYLHETGRSSAPASEDGLPPRRRSRRNPARSTALCCWRAPRSTSRSGCRAGSCSLRAAAIPPAAAPCDFRRFATNTSEPRARRSWWSSTEPPTRSSFSRRTRESA